MSGFSAAHARSRPSPGSAAKAAARATLTRPLGQSNQAIQAKLRVGPVDDPLEREADRVADAVLGGNAPHQPLSNAGPQLQRQATAGLDQDETADEEEAETEPAEPETVEVGRDVFSDEEDTIQAKARPGGVVSTRAHEAAAAVSDGGVPLASDVRSYFEPRFGHDLSGIRMHTGRKAAEAAGAINARAFTLGRNIAFAAGEYAPQSAFGRRLIAHEITHVLQQSAGASASPVPVIRRWTRQGVLNELCGNFGQIAINAIRLQRIRIRSFTNAFDRWRFPDGTERENSLPGLRGNTRIDRRTIRLRQSLSDRSAASTLFHEMQHWFHSRRRTPITGLESEIRARIATERYHIMRGWPESVPGYRLPNGTVDEAFIRSEVMGSPHYNPQGRVRVGRRYVGERAVRGWRCP